MKTIIKSGLLLSPLLLSQTADVFAQVAKQPNIIWITCEDISPYIGAYGDKVVKTPNIDQLTKEGVKYQSVYTVAGVSSPSRAAIITGMYPISVGAQHMRTEAIDPIYMGEGVPNYSAVLPYYVKPYPEYLRKAGYYTSNNLKQDFQFKAPVTVWDECGAAASYANRPANKPFFSIFNLCITHESQLFKTSTLFEGHEDLLVDPAKVEIPPIYKDTKTSREDMARLLSNIQLMDYHVGEIIQQLKADGVYDNSYVFFYSDHGGCLPWTKREVLERGTHIPFVIKHPKAKYAGTVNTDLISSVDFAPTVLSLAGIKVPEYMHGQAFLGTQTSKTSRQYVFAARDRMDEHYDRVRSVRDNKFRYIYNFMPEKPSYQDLAFRRNIPMMNEMVELHKQGKLNAQQDAWFKAPKAIEELYDVENDPNEMNNLASYPQYKDKLLELRYVLKTWLADVGDMSYISEKEMVYNWWGGKDTAPVTATPLIEKTALGIKISCPTKGASIGYKIIRTGKEDAKIKRKVQTWDGPYVSLRLKNGSEIEVDSPWDVYTDGKVINLNKGDKLLVNAMRIGYQPALTEWTQN